MNVNRWFLFGLFLVLCLLGLMSILAGSTTIPLVEGVNLIAAKIGVELDAQHIVDLDIKQAIIFEIRFPRVILAILTGMTLATSGAVMQGLFRNPLADPGLMGISAGCAFGAAMFAVFGAQWFGSMGNITAQWGLPFAAFLGGLVSTWLVFIIGRDGQRTDVATMLLAGVAINIIASSGTSALQFIANDQALRGVVFWLMGDLGSVSWQQLKWIAPVQIATIITMLCYAPTLNALLLGEAEAQHIGFNTERSKRMLIFLVALSVGLSVSIAGVIGFVGLVVPHIVRRFAGANHLFLLPASALLGAILLLCADYLSRTLISPTEIPVGIIMALVGGPFFIWLLLTTRYRFSK